MTVHEYLSRYDALWARARSSYETGDLVIDRPPVDGDARWGLSLVVLPGAELHARLVEATDALADRMAGPQTVVAPSDLHMTVTSLEPYRDEVDPVLVDAYWVAAGEALRGGMPQVSFRGLGGSAAGVFAQGFADDRLLAVRRRMREVGAALHGGEPPTPAFIRDTAHVSLTVHRAAAPESHVAAFVDSARDVPLGDLRGACLALVRYREVGGAMRLEPIASTDLSG
ncbi:2'-5' RNA ligase family protein [Curtobacterium sp. SP.BCp]|uniref:2'-5' RNA ligase family protein n=1 Tax=Curtobacterium sp. SP.BCp TaxID=3435230 RepID=UPI003F7350F6